jgi:predicted AAA+ superfamily ATPase
VKSSGKRHGRVGIALANQVALFCLRNTGCELSVNRLVGALREVGYKTSWETVSETVRFFCQAHLLSLLPEYSTSLSPDSPRPAPRT